MTLYADESIDRIVNSSKMLDEDEKVLFRELFKSLSREQEILFSDIKEYVKSEGTPAGWATEKWEIVTALVPRADLGRARREGLFPVIPEKDLPAVEERTETPEHLQLLEKDGWYAGFAFLNCDWANTERYCNTAYHARLTTAAGEMREVSYHLRSYNSILFEREKILEETAAQYGVARPYLLSPFSRRLVQVQLDSMTVNADGIQCLDLDFAGNRLADVLITDRMPVWNLEIQERGQLRSPNLVPPVVPESGKTYAKYQIDLPEKGPAFLHMEETDADVTFADRGEKSVQVRVLLGPGEEPSCWNWNYQQICLHPVRSVPETFRLFRNEICHEIAKIPRVRTKGDVQRVVNRFCPSGIRFLGIQEKLASEQSIRTYDKRNAYHYYSEETLRSHSNLYLRFEPEAGQELFFADLVSYLLAFLNDQYPEYRWVGEK